MSHQPIKFFDACCLSIAVVWIITLLARTDSERAASRESTAVIRPEVLAPIAREHEELLVALAEARRSGRTGPAAERVAKLLTPHFEKEEQFALPPLAMRRPFAGGETPANAEELLALTERFRAEYPTMLEEHQAIVLALDEPRRGAQAEKKHKASEFAEGLIRHAEVEEKILYPTTVLIGEFLKLALAK